MSMFMSQATKISSALAIAVCLSGGVSRAAERVSVGTVSPPASGATQATLHPTLPSYADRALTPATLHPTLPSFDGSALIQVTLHPTLPSVTVAR